MNLEKGEKVLLASYHPLETCMFYFVFWFLASLRLWISWARGRSESELRAVPQLWQCWMLNPLRWPEIELAPQHSRDATDPAAPRGELLLQFLKFSPPTKRGHSDQQKYDQTRSPIHKL